MKNFWNSSIKKKLLSQVVANNTTNNNPILSSNNHHHLNYLPNNTSLNNLIDHNHHIVGGFPPFLPLISNSIISPNYLLDPLQNHNNQEQIPHLINSSNQSMNPIIQGFDNLDHTFLPPIDTSNYDPTFSSSGFHDLINEVGIDNHSLDYQFGNFHESCTQSSSIIHPSPYHDDHNRQTIMKMKLTPMMPKLETMISFEGEVSNTMPSSLTSHYHDHDNTYHTIPKPALITLSCIPNPQVLEYYLNHEDHDEHHVMLPSLPSSSSSSSSPPPPSSSSLAVLPCGGSGAVMNPSIIPSTSSWNA